MTFEYLFSRRVILSVSCPIVFDITDKLAAADTFPETLLNDLGGISPKFSEILEVVFFFQSWLSLKSKQLITNI